MNSKIISKYSTAVSDLLFPPVCACCGKLTIERSDIICDDCLGSRFEADEGSEKVILPEVVSFHYSLWKFDKMGYLQGLLHKLKYDHLTGVGTSLGRHVGKELLRSEIIEAHFGSRENLILIPVPLHKKRYRKRGYNQAQVIAEGISSKTGIEVIREHSILRRKNTVSQTGLNSDERSKNLSQAFQVNRPDLLEGREPLIVDDVYTTGATTFELATTLHKYTKHRSAIITVART